MTCSFFIVQIIQLLHQHFKVECLTLTGQAHPYYWQWIIFHCAKTSDQPMPQTDSIRHEGRICQVEIAKRIRTGSLSGLDIEFHSRLEMASGRKSGLILRAIIHYQPVPASLLRVRK